MLAFSIHATYHRQVVRDDHFMILIILVFREADTHLIDQICQRTFIFSLHGTEDS